MPNLIAAGVAGYGTAALRYGRSWAEGPRMKSFERHRRYAADCLKMARAASNEGYKARLLQMAEAWRHLAELAEASDTAVPQSGAASR
jgi:hypothetical protein